MLHKLISEIAPMTAGDGTLLREVAHPKNDDIALPYSLAHASLETGAASIPHILHHSSELYIVLEGNGTAFVGEEAFALEAGTVVLVPPDTPQYVRNEGAGPLLMYCIVSPPWSARNEEIIAPSEG